MSQELKVFHLGDLLSVTTPFLLSPTHMAGVQALLEHVTGETRESDMHLVDMGLRARPELLRQHPWLEYAVPPEDIDRNELMTWFAHQVVERGNEHEVLGVETVDNAVELVASDD